MSRRLENIVRRLQSAGHQPEHVQQAARTIARFDTLERMDLVRIRVEEDQEAYNDPDAFACYCDDPECESREGEPIRDMVNRLGAYGTIAEWRYSEDDEWQHADSCWSHIGYNDPSSPYENAYVLDGMDAALDAFRDHHRHAVAHRLVADPLST